MYMCQVYIKYYMKHERISYSFGGDKIYRKFKGSKNQYEIIFTAF